MLNFVFQILDNINIPTLFEILLDFILFSLVTIVYFLFEHKHISRGIRNPDTLKITWDGPFFANLFTLSAGYFSMALFAYLTFSRLILPFLKMGSENSVTNSSSLFLIVFVLSSGIIIRYTYVLVDPAMANSIWNFYAVPAIIILTFSFYISSSAFNFNNGIISSIPLFLLCCFIGIIAEFGLILLKAKLRSELDRDKLHEVLDLVPMDSQILWGREKIYRNLANMLKNGSNDEPPHTAVGTSIFFDCWEHEEFNTALNKFCKCGEVKYLGPTKRQSWESENHWKSRELNLINRANCGVQIRDYSINPSSFRFLVVNNRYVSIEFPQIYKYPQKSGFIPNVELLKSTKAVSFENSMIANMLVIIFNSMWDNSSPYFAPNMKEDVKLAIKNQANQKKDIRNTIFQPAVFSCIVFVICLILVVSLL